MIASIVRGSMYLSLTLNYSLNKLFSSTKTQEKESYWTPFKMEEINFEEFKMSNPIILGISAYFHDSSACILKNGKIIAAADEERFTRIKHDVSFPINAIKFCLEEAKVKDVDIIAFFENPMEKWKRISKSYTRNLPKYSFYKEVLETWGEKKIPSKIVEKLEDLGFSAPIVFLNHHLCHAASSYLLSPFKEAAILTIDGVGEKYTTTMGYGKGKEIFLNNAIEFPHSIGLLYSTITAFMGFKVNNDEYKIMGMAAYGNPAIYYDKIRSLIEQKEDGSFKLNMELFDFEAGSQMYSKKLEELFGMKKRGKEAPVLQEHKDLAAALQKVTEELIFKLLNSLYSKTKCKNLCIAGGVALNSLANGKILSKTPFKSLFIQPESGDGGTVLGAVTYVYHKVDRNSKREHMTHSYYGPQYSDAEIKAYLDENKIKYSEFNYKNLLLSQVSDLLMNKKIIGWFQGRMEWGPRALGNRSILASPCYEDMRDIINAKVKHREMFRPFAPVVCVDDASTYFECDKPIPEPTDYMLMVYPIKKQFHKKIPAVTHVDGSGRLQTIRKNQNTLYYDLIKAFGKKSGIPILINTSFNIRGEPIVCTPYDAYKCMMGTGIDYLVMGKFLIKRSDNPKDMWNSEAKE